MSLIAPWVRNTFRMAGTAAEIHANFNRTVTAPAGQNVTGLPAQRQARVVRPGAILLANLDIDETAPRTRFGVASRDAANHIVDQGDDQNEVTLFYVAEPNPVPGTTASRIDLQLHALDAARVRIWKIPNAASMRQNDPPVLGVHAAGTSAAHRMIGHWIKPAPAWQTFFGIEALSLAGDPRFPAPGGGTPNPPGRRQVRPRGDVGSEVSVVVQLNTAGQPMYAARGPGDIWLSAVHYDWNDAAIADLADQALFTIAPWLMTWNTLPCERVYVVYRTPSNVLGQNNHPMVWDLQQACNVAGLANGAPHAPNADSTVAITPNTRADIVAGHEIPFYVIDGGAFGNDKWIQDEIEIGYCWAPHKWMHVVLHCPRRRSDRDLGSFAEDDMPHIGLGVFNGIATNSMFGADTQNFGGNLEVSPPVLNPTNAILANNAGLAVRAHRAAPLGKIIWGDGDATNARRCENPYRNFLRAQIVQPILPIDTSWLTVAHVDEILTFIRAGGGARANGDYAFKMLFASVDAADILYDEATAQVQHVTLHAGKVRVTTHTSVYDEAFVNDVLLGADMIASRLTQASKLTPIEARLRAGLDIPNADVIPVPVFFHEENIFGAPTSVAHTPGMMNLLVVNTHLMIPRPFGPRMARADATTALGAALTRIFNARGLPIPGTVVPGAPGGAGGDGLYFWAAPGTEIDTIAAYFIDPVNIMNPFTPRRAIIDAITNDNPIPPAYTVAVTTLRNNILGHVLNTGAATPIGTAMTGTAFNRWMKIWIPDGRVDLTEAYMASVLAGTGNTLHFIDDFETYHSDYGEVHCGTNARRSPPETVAGFNARWWDLRVYDTAYNTSY